ncbi:708_t:CDS:2 [Ambispora leptoticha]|uniref:MICOS complex subunit MIC10 n=1 Tax=Ambispora leptoticha TaxID=144679 RepID=A0A9N9DE70_9GLOM|nr:708_t:CDS:2 [Ambispora leptoticha]
MVDKENIPSEEILNEKWDKCISNFLVKTGIGLSVGIIASALIFRKRTWPIAMSTGFGIGVAYADCQRTFVPTPIPGVRIVKAYKNIISDES